MYKNCMPAPVNFLNYFLSIFAEHNLLFPWQNTENSFFFQMPRPPPVTEQAITTEAELLAKNQITPNDVLALPGITQGK